MSTKNGPTFRLRYRSANPPIQGERLFTQLPIRIGRSPVNDCVIANGFISNLHAAIELVDGRPCVRDVGSRNGVYSREGERIEVNTPISLEQLQNEFVLGPQMRVTVEFGEPDVRLGVRQSKTSGRVLGNVVAMEESPDRWHQIDETAGRSEVPALPVLSQEGLDGLRYLSDDPGRGELAPKRGRQGSDARDASAAHPRAAADDRAPAARGTEHFALGIETMALLGLRELAASLMPGVPVQTTGDVARLLTKVHDAVDVFCRCFIAIRDSHPVSGAVAEAAGRRGGPAASASAREVEAAPDPASVAAALLDWRNHDYGSSAAVETIVTEVVGGQRALLDRIMLGAREVLEDVSPETIRQAVESRRLPGVFGAIGRHRALWRTFEAHFDECSDPARAAARFLGPELAEMYQQHLGRRDIP